MKYFCGTFIEIQEISEQPRKDYSSGSVFIVQIFILRYIWIYPTHYELLQWKVGTHPVIEASLFKNGCRSVSLLVFSLKKKYNLFTNLKDKSWFWYKY